MKRIISSILTLVMTMSISVVPVKSAYTVEPTVYADMNHFEIDFADADLSSVDLNEIKLEGTNTSDAVFTKNGSVVTITPKDEKFVVDSEYILKIPADFVPGLDLTGKSVTIKEVLNTKTNDLSYDNIKANNIATGNYAFSGTKLFLYANGYLNAVNGIKDYTMNFDYAPLEWGGITRGSKTFPNMQYKWNVYGDANYPAVLAYYNDRLNVSKTGKASTASFVSIGTKELVTGQFYQSTKEDQEEKGFYGTLTAEDFENISKEDGTIACYQKNIPVENLTITKRVKNSATSGQVDLSMKFATGAGTEDEQSATMVKTVGAEIAAVTGSFAMSYHEAMMIDNLVITTVVIEDISVSKLSSTEVKFTDRTGEKDYIEVNFDKDIINKEETLQMVKLFKLCTPDESIPITTKYIDEKMIIIPSGSSILERNAEYKITIFEGMIKSSDGEQQIIIGSDTIFNVGSPVITEISDFNAEFDYSTEEIKIEMITSDNKYPLDIIDLSKIKIFDGESNVINVTKDMIKVSDNTISVNMSDYTLTGDYTIKLEKDFGQDFVYVTKTEGLSKQLVINAKSLDSITADYDANADAIAVEINSTNGYPVNFDDTNKSLIVLYEVNGEENIAVSTEKTLSTDGKTVTINATNGLKSEATYRVVILKGYGSKYLKVTSDDGLTSNDVITPQYEKLELSEIYADISGIDLKFDKTLNSVNQRIKLFDVRAENNIDINVELSEDGNQVFVIPKNGKLKIARYYKLIIESGFGDTERKNPTKIEKTFRIKPVVNETFNTTTVSKLSNSGIMQGVNWAVGDGKLVVFEHTFIKAVKGLNDFTMTFDYAPGKWTSSDVANEKREMPFETNKWRINVYDPNSWTREIVQEWTLFNNGNGIHIKKAEGNDFVQIGSKISTNILMSNSVQTAVENNTIPSGFTADDFVDITQSEGQAKAINKNCNYLPLTFERHVKNGAEADTYDVTTIIGMDKGSYEFTKTLSGAAAKAVNGAGSFGFSYNDASIIDNLLVTVYEEAAEPEQEFSVKGFSASAAGITINFTDDVGTVESDINGVEVYTDGKKIDTGNNYSISGNQLFIKAEIKEGKTTYFRMAVNMEFGGGICAQGIEKQFVIERNSSGIEKMRETAEKVGILDTTAVKDYNSIKGSVNIKKYDMAINPLAIISVYGTENNELLGIKMIRLDGNTTKADYDFTINKEVTEVKVMLLDNIENAKQYCNSQIIEVIE